MSFNPQTLEKPLALLASIPEGDGAALLERLTVVQIKRLAECVPSNPLVHHNMPDELADDLRSMDRAKRERPAGTVSATESRHLVAESDPVTLATLLEHELPQTVAAVLRPLPPSTAASVISSLRTDLQLGVAQRLATNADTSVEVLSEVCLAIVHRTQARGSRPLESHGGPVMLARMLDRMDTATERALIENLAQQDSLLLEQVRNVRTLLHAIRSARFVERRDHSDAA